jgi:hypothetical protein
LRFHDLEPASFCLWFLLAATPRPVISQLRGLQQAPGRHPFNALSPYSPCGRFGGKSKDQIGQTGRRYPQQTAHAWHCSIRESKKKHRQGRIDWLATEQWCPRPVTAAPTTEDDIAVPTHCISPRPRSGASHCPRTTRGHSPWRTSWTLTRRLRESALPSQ